MFGLSERIELQYLVRVFSFRESSLGIHSIKRRQHSSVAGDTSLCIVTVFRKNPEKLSRMVENGKNEKRERDGRWKTRPRERSQERGESNKGNSDLDLCSSPNLVLSARPCDPSRGFRRRVRSELREKLGQGDAQIDVIKTRTGHNFESVVLSRGRTTNKVDELYNSKSFGFNRP